MLKNDAEKKKNVRKNVNSLRKAQILVKNHGGLTKFILQSSKIVITTKVCGNYYTLRLKSGNNSIHSL